MLNLKKDIGPYFITICGILLVLGSSYIFITSDDFGTLFLGVFFMFGILVIIKGIRDIKLQRKGLLQNQSNTLNTTTSVVGTGIALFLGFCLIAGILLILLFSQFA